MNVKIYSRKELNDRLKERNLENTLLIAFYDPQDDLPTFSGKAERVITLPITDLDKEDLEEYGYTVDSFFSQADPVAEFIVKAVRDGLDIACACEYGESRSAGCAAAIKEFYDGNGIEIFADERYYPNKIIYNKLLTALRKQPEVRKFYVHNLPYNKKVSLALLEYGYLSAGTNGYAFSDFKVGDEIYVPINKEEVAVVRVIETPKGINALIGIKFDVDGKFAEVTEEGVRYEDNIMDIWSVARVEMVTEKNVAVSELGEEVRVKINSRSTNNKVNSFY